MKSIYSITNIFDFTEYLNFHVPANVAWNLGNRISLWKYSWNHLSVRLRASFFTKYFSIVKNILVSQSFSENMRFFKNSVKLGNLRECYIFTKYHSNEMRVNFSFLHTKYSERKYFPISGHVNEIFLKKKRMWYNSPKMWCTLHN